MQTEIEKLYVQVKRADKLALERIAQAEGNSVSVVVRRILREALRTSLSDTSSDQPVHPTQSSTAAAQQ